MKRIPDEMVAKIMGALQAQLPFKVIAKHAGVSYWTVRAVARGDRKVPSPDDSMAAHIRAWFQLNKPGHDNG